MRILILTRLIGFESAATSVWSLGVRPRSYSSMGRGQPIQTETRPQIGTRRTTRTKDKYQKFTELSTDVRRSSKHGINSRGQTQLRQQTRRGRATAPTGTRWRRDPGRTRSQLGQTRQRTPPVSTDASESEFLSDGSHSPMKTPTTTTPLPSHPTPPPGASPLAATSPARQGPPGSNASRRLRPTRCSNDGRWNGSTP